MRFLFSFLTVTLVAFSITAAAQVREEENIRVVTVQGAAFVVPEESEERLELRAGDEVSAGATLITENGARLVLLFSNGATVSMAARTTMNVDEFLHGGGSNPNPSTTELSLDFGEIFGNVERLDGSSKLEVKTPVGTAGIRGTTFRISYDPATGTCVISNVEGTVEWMRSGETIDVADGEELIVVARVAEDGSIEVVTVNQAIDPEKVREIVRAIYDGIRARLTPGGRNPFPPTQIDGSILSPAR